MKHVAFVYTASGHSLVLTLRRPLLGNRKILIFGQTIKRAMSGKIYTYKTLPPTIRFDLQFEHETRPKILEVINFLRTTAGKTIKYYDHHGSLYHVVVLTQPFDETHVNRRNNTFALQLEVMDSVPTGSSIFEGSSASSIPSESGSVHCDDF